MDSAPPPGSFPRGRRLRSPPAPGPRATGGRGEAQAGSGGAGDWEKGPQAEGDGPRGRGGAAQVGADAPGLLPSVLLSAGEGTGPSPFSRAVSVPRKNGERGLSLRAGAGGSWGLGPDRRPPGPGPPHLQAGPSCKPVFPLCGPCSHQAAAAHIAPAWRPCRGCQAFPSTRGSLFDS